MTVKVKVSLYLIKNHAIKACVVVKVQLHTFLTSVRDGAFTFTLRPPYGREIEAGTGRMGPKGGLNPITVPLAQGTHYTD